MEMNGGNRMKGQLIGSFLISPDVWKRGNNSFLEDLKETCF